MHGQSRAARRVAARILHSGYGMAIGLSDIDIVVGECGGGMQKRSCTAVAFERITEQEK